MLCENHSSKGGCAVVTETLDDLICVQGVLSCHCKGSQDGREIVSMSPQVPEPAGAFWGCVVIAAAVMVGTVALAHQTGKIANHLMTTLSNQGDRITSTAERMTNTSERLAMAIAHQSDRLATTGERIASVAETIDINVNYKHD